MATEMCDTALLTKLAEGDLVAIEAKYHFNCLSRYRNQYRGYLRAKADSSRSLQLADKKAKARAFAELISYIETALEEDTHIFKLSELHAAYLERLQNFGLSLSVNKTRLKDDIIDHFFYYGVQEQFSGTKIVLIFPEGLWLLCIMFTLHYHITFVGMKRMLQSADSCQSDALQIVKVSVKKYLNLKYSGFPATSLLVLNVIVSHTISNCLFQ